MLRGIRHPSCEQCWMNEDQGVQSAREFRLPVGWVSTATNSEVDKNLGPDSILKNVETKEKIKISEIDENSSILLSHSPYMLEINLNNHCDMSCLYCGPHFSSTWLNKNTEIWAERVGRKNFDKNDHQRLRDQLTSNPSENFQKAFWPWFEKILATSISGFRLGIVGGEPIGNPMLPELIDRICETLDKIDLPKRPHSGYQKSGNLIQNNKPLLWFVTNLNARPHHWKSFINQLLKAHFLLYG